MANLTPVNSLDSVRQLINTDQSLASVFNAGLQALLNRTEWCRVRMVPIGGIILWGGQIASVPDHFHLCDGTNGTPDLRDRFVVGSGSAYSQDATGGSANAVVVAHSHGIADPGHNHSDGYHTKLSDGSVVFCQPSAGGFSAETGYANADILASGTGISINDEGVPGTGKNLPPYYALAYIMRIS